MEESPTQQSPWHTGSIILIAILQALQDLQQQIQHLLKMDLVLGAWSDEIPLKVLR